MKRPGMVCFITDGIAEPVAGLAMTHGGRAARVADDCSGVYLQVGLY